MNVKEIIEAWLKANGHDGLHTDHCGCFIGDLIPCESSTFGEYIGGCRPGYKYTVKEGDKYYNDGFGVGQVLCGPEKEIEKL